jgi:hypothetical protein
MVVAANCGAWGLSLGRPSICWRVGSTRDSPVEALFPEGGERFELGSSRWSQVFGIDAVGGSPDRDSADESAGMSSPRGPGWRDVSLIGVILDLAGEVGDLLGSHC